MSRNSASSVQYRPASRVVRAVIYATAHADIRLTGAYIDEQLDGALLDTKARQDLRGAFGLEWDDAGMGRQLIRTDLAPGSSLYSQGVRAGDHICVSGMTGTDPATGALAGGTIQEQTRQAIANCLAILEAGGAGYDDIVEVGVLLTNPADFAGLNEQYARAFPTDPPARYVAKLGVELPGVLVSIRMTAITS
jgi:2-iminobutanoate/2-iminopropanoate deaminase